MNRHILILLLMLAGASSLHAQDSSLYKYSQDSIIKTTVMRNGKYFSVRYSANGNLISRKDIIERIQAYEPSALEFQQYNNTKASVAVWAVLTVGASIISAVQTSQHNTGAGYAVGGIAVGCIIMELISAIHVGMHWDRAIQKYNSQFRQ